MANDTVDQDVTGAVYNKANIKSVELSYDLDLKTDSQQSIESGTLFLTHNPTTDGWEISQQNVDYGTAVSGVTFAVTNTGQLQLSSSDFTGANYSGTLRFTAKQKSQA